MEKQKQPSRQIYNLKLALEKNEVNEIQVLQLDSHNETIPDWLYDSVDDIPAILHISYFDDDKEDLTIEELDMSKPSTILSLTNWVSDLSDIELSDVTSSYTKNFGKDASMKAYKKGDGFIPQQKYNENQWGQQQK